jgi:carbamoyl-phosphate synthase small subunit
LLALADGTIFHGQSIGAPVESTGEIVFNTSMSGYQEILTDPSYASQIVTLTCPHIGNVGVNPEDVESEQVFAAGLVIRDLSMVASNFRSVQSLTGSLEAAGVPGIAEIDTRKLTRILREKGAQGGCLVAAPAAGVALDVDRALVAARRFPGLAGMDLAQDVTCSRAYPWTEGVWALGTGHAAAPDPRFHVVAYDFGMKQNILRDLRQRGLAVRVVPADTSAEDVLAMDPDGIFLSNGPGDPAALGYIHKNVRALLGKKPIFGICLGHQILGYALGGKTFKLKFGHRGGNQPVKDLTTGKVSITSQNHGFAVDADSLPSDTEVTHINLNDGTVEGLRSKSMPVFSVQYHPEAAPGPHDAAYFFDQFADLIAETKGQR